MEALSVAKDILRNAGVDFKSLSVIHMNRSTATETSLALLIFIDHGSCPLAFMKATPDPEKAKLFELEFNNLSFLCDHGSPKFIKAIPKPLYFGKSSHYTVLAETANPGIRMKNFPPNVYFSSHRFRQHFTSVVQWLYEFNRCMADHQSQAISSDIEKVLNDPVREYRQNFYRSEKLDYLLYEAIECLKTGNISLNFRHGDFCTANILVSDAQQISVIDWEHPLTNSWPLSDILYFISSLWCIPYIKSKSGRVKNFRHLFFTRNRHADLIRKSVAWYMQKLGIEAGLVLPLSIIAWVLYANGKRSAVEKTGNGAGAAGKSTEPLPLTIVENDYCLNLEVIAENHERYILNSLF